MNQCRDLILGFGNLIIKDLSKLWGLNQESLEFGILILDELYLSYLACISNPLGDSNDSCNDLFGYALSLFFIGGFFVLLH